MTLYRYYCADTDCGKHFCLMAKDDMEAAYRAASMAKEWYNTTLKDFHAWDEGHVSQLRPLYMLESGYSREVCY